MNWYMSLLCIWWYQKTIMEFTPNTSRNKFRHNEVNIDARNAWIVSFESSTSEYWCYIIFIWFGIDLDGLYSILMAIWILMIFTVICPWKRMEKIGIAKSYWSNIIRQAKGHHKHSIDGLFARFKSIYQELWLN